MSKYTKIETKQRGGHREGENRQGVRMEKRLNGRMGAAGGDGDPGRRKDRPATKRPTRGSRSIRTFMKAYVPSDAVGIRGGVAFVP